MILPTYVLNLPRDTERRDLALAELARVGLTAEVVPGVDGGALSAAQMARLDRPRSLSLYGVEMLPAEVGCFLGHERVLERIVDAGCPAALVLEDDIRLHDALPAILEALVSTAPPWPWQVVRLAGMRPRKIAQAVARSAPVRSLGPDHALYRLKTHVLGAQGYVVTRDGAQRLLDQGRRIVLPWDQTMDRFWENGIDPYVVAPFPVAHRTELPSAIGTRDPARRYAMGTGTLWRRRLNRWKDSIAKRWYIVRHLSVSAPRSAL